MKAYLFVCLNYLFLRSLCEVKNVKIGFSFGPGAKMYTKTKSWMWLRESSKIYIQISGGQYIFHKFYLIDTLGCRATLRARCLRWSQTMHKMAQWLNCSTKSGNHGIMMGKRYGYVHSVPHNSNSLISNYRLFRRPPSAPKITPLTQC